MFGVDELGMDLGTSTLHIVVRGKGIVLSEPAYVAYDRQTRNVVAVGEEARRMYGRTPAGLIVERPLRDGRIRSFDLVSKMLRYCMRKVTGKRAAFRPKLLLALPAAWRPASSRRWWMFWSMRACAVLCRSMKALPPQSAQACALTSRMDA